MTIFAEAGVRRLLRMNGLSDENQPDDISNISFKDISVSRLKGCQHLYNVERTQPKDSNVVEFK